MMIVLLAVAALAILLVSICIAFGPECTICHAKRSFQYRHRKKDGGPDLRYGNNPMICMRCGNIRGTIPVTAEKEAEKDRWSRHGFDVGRSGGKKDIPAEIRPLAGNSTVISCAWYSSWFRGNREYMWEVGFAEGLRGQATSGTFDIWKHQAWIEGDAKRRGLHYFPTSTSTTKIDPRDK